MPRNRHSGRGHPIYAASGSVYDCITDGGRATEVGRDSGLLPGEDGYTAPGPDQLSLPDSSGGSAPGFPGGNPNQPLPQSRLQALSTISNPSQRAFQAQAWRHELAQGVEYHSVGLAGSDVSAVTFDFTDGSTVDATVHDGWYFAWWPNLNYPTSVNVTTTSGQTTTSTMPCQPDSNPCVFANDQQG